MGSYKSAAFNAAFVAARSSDRPETILTCKCEILLSTTPIRYTSEISNTLACNSGATGIAVRKAKYSARVLNRCAHQQDRIHRDVRL